MNTVNNAMRRAGDEVTIPRTSIRVEPLRPAGASQPPPTVLASAAAVSTAFGLVFSAVLTSREEGREWALAIRLGRGWDGSHVAAREFAGGDQTDRDRSVRAGKWTLPLDIACTLIRGTPIALSGHVD